MIELSTLETFNLLDYTICQAFFRRAIQLTIPSLASQTPCENTEGSS